MSAPDILANMSRGWNRDPAGVVRGTDRTGVSAALWAQGREDRQEIRAEPDPTLHILCLPLSSYQTEMFLDERPVFNRRTVPGHLNLIKAGERPRAVTSGRLQCLHLYLPVDLVLRFADEITGAAEAVELVDPRCGADRYIERIGHEVLAEMRGEERLSRLRVDTLGQDLVIQLLRRHSSLSGTRAVSRGPARSGLASWQVRRVNECITEHLGEDVSLAALASLVDLTPNHFCTAFRISFGEPPHRYLIRRRIERAKEMLADQRLSVTDVALAVGFGSSAHFATAFRKQVGVAPTAYRRERVL